VKSDVSEQAGHGRTAGAVVFGETRGRDGTGGR
jgi:hypothetical protein